MFHSALRQALVILFGLLVGSRWVGAQETFPDRPMNKGKVTRGYLGVVIQKVTPEIAELLGMDRPNGALVADVRKGSPAQSAGINVGDVITEFDGEEIKDSQDLPILVARTAVDQKVRVRVLRDKKELALLVTVGELKDEGIVAPVPEKEVVGKQAQSPGTVFRDCPDCPEMVVIPSGSFIMGSPESESGRDKDEGPQHNVTIPRPFAVGRYEVTRGQFASFVRETGYVSKGRNCSYYDSAVGEEQDNNPNVDWRNPGYSQGNNHPVDCVSWHDAKAYAAWLSRKTGKNYRLLSEAEWEYAARAGTARPWGENPNMACGFANITDRTFIRDVPAGPGKEWTEDYYQCNDGYAYTAPVGSYRPNNFGLYDMIGNVGEWVEDCYNESYRGAPSDGSAWLSGNCSGRISRGGSFHSGPITARFAIRLGTETGFRADTFGFRLARDL